MRPDASRLDVCGCPGCGFPFVARPLADAAAAGARGCLQKVVYRGGQTGTTEALSDFLHGQAPDIESFETELAAATGVPRESMTRHLIGASVGPHVGPGAYGAVVLAARA